MNSPDSWVTYVLMLDIVDFKLYWKLINSEVKLNYCRNWVLGEPEGFLCKFFPVLFYGFVAATLFNLCAVTINRFVVTMGTVQWPKWLIIDHFSDGWWFTFLQMWMRYFHNATQSCSLLWAGYCLSFLFCPHFLECGVWMHWSVFQDLAPSSMTNTEIRSRNSS